DDQRRGRRRGRPQRPRRPGPRGDRAGGVGRRTAPCRALAEGGLKWGRRYACAVSGEPETAPGAGLDPAAKAELDRAFEDLYRAHLRDVYSYSYYRVGNHHDAEDL